MQVTHRAAAVKRSAARPSIWLSAAAMLIAGCSDRCSKPAPEAPRPSLPAPLPPDPAPPADTSAPADTVSADTAGPALTFRSKPAARAYLDHTYIYKPVFSLPGKVSLRVAKGPDSLLAVKGALQWTPRKEGAYPVVLEAALARQGADTLRARQAFTIAVSPVLVLALKPLPAEAGKGEPVAFDLSASVFPEWAAGKISLRFDYDGDGQWDAANLPWPAGGLHRYAFPRVGKFSPRVEARYGEEVRAAEASVSIISAVDAALRLSPDTVEPGGAVTVDASGTKGDGRLTYRLDLDGDGAIDWVDSASGKGVLKAPATGTYAAQLTAANAMGRQGKATATLRVNARPQIEVKVKNPKAHMAEPVEVRVRARDADDSVREVRMGFTGDAQGPGVAKTRPDSAKGAGEWYVKFEHAYGKVGKYEPFVCMLAADGRGACKQLQVEVFNAAPVCQPGEEIRATLGKPVEIEGKGADPDGRIVKWEWDLDGDGKYDLTSKVDGRFKYTFAREGKFSLTLKVTTEDGMSATGDRKVEVRKKWKS